VHQEKGDRYILCEAPSGPFRQNVPVPFFLASPKHTHSRRPVQAENVEASMRGRPSGSRQIAVRFRNSPVREDGVRALPLRRRPGGKNCQPRPSGRGYCVHCQTKAQQKTPLLRRQRRRGEYFA